ncbi:MAG TPA: hypothetical protein VFV89_24705 [Nocardioides sp.]|uniref:hypothetical protein n=1 Tax=Nocardioides sp. TaxID=35761 RepID=UPI002E32C2B5|nr:hypothetical protein [Nocardioides sp.]HEX5091036.1 hypothetical protein [Nocardioides sp.]
MRLRLPALHGAGLPGVAAAMCVGLGFALLAGCGGDPEPPSGPGLPSQADLRTYFEAITSGDPEQVTKAEEIAADGSPAQAYARFIGLATTAWAAAGEDAPADVEVEDVDRGFKACVSDDRCATWTDLEGKDGKLTSFSVSGIMLDDSFVDLTGQAPISSEGLYDVQPEYAYRLPQSGVLEVVLTITAAEVGLSARPGTYIEGDQVLKGSQAAGPALIKAGRTSPVMLVFPGAEDAKLDGQVTFALKIGGAGSDSIGFGLADPAVS